MRPSRHLASGLPARAGLGLKPQHVAQILQERPALGFFEVHAENYLVDGGRYHQDLTAVRQHYALSIHGVGLSLGGEAPLCVNHLDRLRQLLDRYQPEAFSEHLAWSRHDGVFFNDLLPVPYTRARLQRVCDHIDQTQHHLGRTLLLENPSTYLRYADADFSETEFLRAVQQRTGCGLLLDVNNVYVSCINHGEDPWAYVRALPLQAVQQIHLAGFAEDLDADGQRLLIDHHGAPVAAAVWDLYQDSLQQLGRAVPTLIERDNHVPALSVLLAEARVAQDHLDRWATKRLAA